MHSRFHEFYPFLSPICQIFSETTGTFSPLIKSKHPLQSSMGNAQAPFGEQEAKAEDKPTPTPTPAKSKPIDVEFSDADIEDYKEFRKFQLVRKAVPPPTPLLPPIDDKPAAS